MTTRRAITLDAETPGGPYLVAECNDKGWNGYHVPHLTAEEMAAHVNAHKAIDPNGWADVSVAPDGSGIRMTTEGGEDFYAYDETGRAWVDGLVWVTAYDEEGNERPVPPTVAETVAKVKAEVLEYVAEGDIPPTVRDYSELHDYCDANTLGGMCDEGFRESFGPFYDGPEDPMVADPWMVHCNEVQDVVHEWLQGGGVVTLTLSREALAVMSALLDFNDDDEELADNTGAEQATIDLLRHAVAAAIRPSGG